MPIYLFALVFSNYKCTHITNFSSNSLEGKNTSVLFQTWAPENFLKDRNENISHTLGPVIMEGFSKLLDIGYLFPKIDQVSFPGLEAQGMENWGLIIYR